ncbi:MAG: LamG-like jellyroll fold domain-containing protein, partial [Verrucomicrobiota bacterium]
RIIYIHLYFLSILSLSSQILYNPEYDFDYSVGTMTEQEHIDRVVDWINLYYGTSYVNDVESAVRHSILVDGGASLGAAPSTTDNIEINISPTDWKTDFVDFPIITTNGYPYASNITKCIYGDYFGGGAILYLYNVTYITGSGCNQSSNTVSYSDAYFSSHALFDDDADGFSDVWEYGPSFSLSTTDSGEVNSDSDSLTDGEEYLLGTSPFLSDTDNDGLDDDDELLAGLDPLDSSSYISPTADSDADGLSDLWEYTVITTAAQNSDSSDDFILLLSDVLPSEPSPPDPVYADSRYWDFDWDGADNITEFTNSTDSNDPDVDYDGRSDGEEIVESTTATDSSSFTSSSLNYWSFDSSTLPHAVDTWIQEGLGVQLDGTGGALVYEDVEGGGAANISLRRGTIRFWFQPLWSEAGFGMPSAKIKFLEMGLVDGGFSLLWDPSTYQIETLFDSGLSQRQTLTATVPGGFQVDEWYHLTLSFSETKISIYLDGILLNSLTTMTESIYPSIEYRDAGFSFGSGIDAQSFVYGILDELETFNYELSASTIFSDYQMVANQDVDLDGIPDRWEWTKFRDLDETNTSDSDGDGLNTLAEYNAGLEPDKWDTDGDGFGDSWEASNSYDPLDGSDLSGAYSDGDSDTLANGTEAIAGTSLTVASDPTQSVPGAANTVVITLIGRGAMEVEEKLTETTIKP